MLSSTMLIFSVVFLVHGVHTSKPNIRIGVHVNTLQASSTATGNDFSSSGISGIDSQNNFLQEGDTAASGPPQGQTRLRSASISNDDANSCWAFLYSECSNKTQDNSQTNLQIVEDKSTCQKACKENQFIQSCKSFLWQFNKQANFYQCWNSKKTLPNLLLDQCKEFLGAVGKEEDALDKCIKDECRTGGCTNINHLGPEILPTQRAPLIRNTEIECKQTCYSAYLCKYYKWHEVTRFCRLYEGAEVPESLTCSMLGGGKKDEECSKDCLRKVTLEVSERSSVFQDDEAKWGAQWVLIPNSTSHNEHYWHSKYQDPHPWISLKLPSEDTSVGAVQVTDRLESANIPSLADRYQRVEVSVGASKDIDQGGRTSCGTQSHIDDIIYKYDECPEGTSGQYFFIERHGKDGVEDVDSKYLQVDYVEAWEKCFNCQNEQTCTHL